MLKKRVVAAVAAALVAGGASAVGVNPGNKGEVLIAPMVMVAGGWESEIRLVNSDTVNSTVVKLSFHEQIRSAEVLDFFVYLSPGDVWRGTAKKQADGKFGIDSDDDSSLYVSSAGANRCPAGTPTSVGFTADKVKSSVPADFTYLTVFQARTFSPTTTVTLNNLTSQLGGAPVDKAKILKAYSDACNVDQPITAALTNNAISGDVTLRNATNGNILNLPMTALENYNNSVYHKTGLYTSFDNNSTNGDALGVTTKARVEDALWANDFVIPFNLTPGNMTYATVTFPTKETYLNSFAGSQYFRNIAGGAPQVSLVARNEKEETIAATGCFVSPCSVDPTNSLPFELNVLALSTDAGAGSSSQVNTSGFTRGWVSMNLQAVPSVTASAPNYSNVNALGAPALVTVIQWEQKGSSLQGAWSYAAKTQNPD